jgi:hypothetical protein
MCRNIKTLFNFEPPATEEEIQASALQFVRKLSGFNKPSQVNEAAFNLAVEQVQSAARSLVHSLVTTAPARNREVEKAKAMAVSRMRFGPANVRANGLNRNSPDNGGMGFPQKGLLDPPIKGSR